MLRTFFSLVCNISHLYLRSFIHPLMRKGRLFFVLSPQNLRKVVVTCFYGCYFLFLISYFLFLPTTPGSLLTFKYLLASCAVFDNELFCFVTYSRVPSSSSPHSSSSDCATALRYTIKRLAITAPPLPNASVGLVRQPGWLELESSNASGLARSSSWYFRMLCKSALASESFISGGSEVYVCEVVFCILHVSIHIAPFLTYRLLSAPLLCCSCWFLTLDCVVLPLWHIGNMTCAYDENSILVEIATITLECIREEHTKESKMPRLVDIEF